MSDQEPKRYKKFVVLAGYRYLDKPRRNVGAGDKRSYYKLIEVYKVRDNGSKKILNLGDTIVQFSNDTEVSQELIPDHSPEEFTKKMNNLLDSESDPNLSEDELTELVKHWVSQLVIQEKYNFIGVVKKPNLSYSSEPKVLRIKEDHVNET